MEDIKVSLIFSYYYSCHHYVCWLFTVTGCSSVLNSDIRLIHSWSYPFIHLFIYSFSTFLLYLFFSSMAAHAFNLLLHPYHLLLLIFLLLLLHLVRTQQCRREDRGDKCDAWKRNERTPTNSKVRSHHSSIYLSPGVCVVFVHTYWMPVLFHQFHYHICSSYFVTYFFLAFEYFIQLFIFTFILTHYPFYLIQ